MEKSSLTATLVKGPRTNLGGFSLIEALIALFLLAFVLAGVGHLMIANVQTSREARHLTAAVNLARSQMETLRGTAYGALTGGNDGPLNEAGRTTGGALMYTRTWTVVASTSPAGGPPIGTTTGTVSTAWTAQNGASRQVQLQTVISQ